MAPPTTPISDPSLAYPNKTALLRAQHHRLISSWLPPPHPTKTKPVSENPIPDPQTNTQPAPPSPSEAEFFSTPLPELCGTGFAPPPTPTANGEADGPGGSRELSTNEKLQKRLLGKDYLRKIKDGQSQKLETGAIHTGSKPKPKPQQASSTKRATNADGSDGEEETGRSSLGKSGSRKKRKEEGDDQPEAEASKDASGETHNCEDAKSKVDPEVAAHSSKKRGSNYLDEVLADRSLKKKRKQSKKDGHSQPATDVSHDPHGEAQDPTAISSISPVEVEIEPAAHPSKQRGSNHPAEVPHVVGAEDQHSKGDGPKVEIEAEGDANPTKEKGTTYLDELLAERSAKKKRKKNKKSTTHQEMEVPQNVSGVIQKGEGDEIKVDAEVEAEAQAPTQGNNAQAELLTDRSQKKKRKKSKNKGSQTQPEAEDVGRKKELDAETEVEAEVEVEAKPEAQSLNQESNHLDEVPVEDPPKKRKKKKRIKKRNQREAHNTAEKNGRESPS